MSSGNLSDKGKALEQSFFHSIDRDLISRLREQMEIEEKRNFLSHLTGVTDPHVIDKLIEIKIDAETITAFTMYPLVAVAWADGKIDQPERDAILKAAGAGSTGEGTVGAELLKQWLTEKPEEKLLSVWQQYVSALCSILDKQQVMELKTEILGHAQTVAESAGGILGLGSKISSSEKEVLDLLAETFSS